MSEKTDEQRLEELTLKARQTAMRLWLVEQRNAAGYHAALMNEKLKEYRAAQTEAAEAKAALDAFQRYLADKNAGA